MTNAHPYNADPETIEKRRAFLYAMHLKGWPVRGIASKAGLSHVAVLKHVETIRKRALQYMTDDVRAHMLEREQQLLMMFTSAWRQWERSIKKGGDGNIVHFNSALAVQDKLIALWQPAPSTITASVTASVPSEDVDGLARLVNAIMGRQADTPKALPTIDVESIPVEE